MYAVFENMRHAKLHCKDPLFTNSKAALPVKYDLNFLKVGGNLSEQHSNFQLLSAANFSPRFTLNTIESRNHQVFSTLIIVYLSD